MRYVDTLKEVAKHFGVIPLTVKRWKADGVAGLSNKPYNLELIDAHRPKRKRDSTVSPPVQPDDDTLVDLTMQIKRADIELKKVKKELAEFQLAAKRNELIEMDDVIDLKAQHAARIKQVTMNMPNTYADRIMDISDFQTAQETLTEIAEDMLGQFGSEG